MAIDLSEFPAEKLEDLVDQFLMEKLIGRRMSIKRACMHRAQLIGLEDSTPSIGYARFLELAGSSSLLVKDFSDSNIKAYREFLSDHCGRIESTQAMGVLRKFWIWCKRNELIAEKKMPSYLQVLKNQKEK